jgi:hypothetical protein
VTSSVSLLHKYFVHLAKEVHHSTLAWRVVESGLERVWHHIMQIIGFIFSVMTEAFSSSSSLGLSGRQSGCVLNGNGSFCSLRPGWSSHTEMVVLILEGAYFLVE